MSDTRNLIERVLYPYNKGVASDDSRPTRRYAYSILKSVRSTLLFNKWNKKQFISHWNYQTLPCVEMIVVPSHECPCLPPIGCEMMRTKYQLPKPVNNISKHLLISVTSIEGSVSFNETTFANKKYKKGNKYTADKPDYFIKDEYLYITVKSRLKAITIIGLFDDPVLAFQYPNICGNTGESCPNPIDTEFYLDGDLEYNLIQMANEEMKLMYDKERGDITNNGQDDSK